jgi:rubrerythrin
VVTISGIIMILTPTQERTLKEMIGLVRAIRDLYKMYAGKLPRSREFWIALASEENEHANMLVALKGQIEKGYVTCTDSRFSKWGIEKMLKYVMHSTTFVGELDLDKALSVALEIERTLLERRFYSCYDSDSDDIKRILRGLESQTENHLRRIKKVWDQQKTNHI